MAMTSVAAEAARRRIARFRIGFRVQPAVREIA